MSASDDLSGRSLLAVFAHPDDESLACGGLLAWCAALGARVSLLCATRGENGLGAGAPAREGCDLAETRTQELEAAARLLGITELVFLEHPDGCLPAVDVQRLAADIREVICRVRPNVVITFGQDGLYWHPDHVAIHEAATAALAALGGDAPALYYVTMPPGSMRALVDSVGERTRHRRSAHQVLGINDPDAFGAFADPPTLVVEVGDFAVQKLAALKCHRSQVGDGALAVITERDAIRLLGTEHFRRAAIGSAADAFIERFAVPS